MVTAVLRLLLCLVPALVEAVGPLVGSLPNATISGYARSFVTNNRLSAASIVARGGQGTLQVSLLVSVATL